MRSERASGSQRRGALYGLAAAALFGLSAPVAKRLLGEVGPQVLAGLLYLGAGVGLSLWKWLRPATREAPLQRSDALPLAGVVVSGGLLGPVLLLVGLERMSAVAGSMLLNLEGPFTVMLAVLVFREHLGRYGLISTALILLGAGLLKVGPGDVELDGGGVLAIAGACLAWAIDNNLTQRLSLRDPLALVRIKTLAAGSINLGLGLALGGALPRASILAIALVMGMLAYGISVVLDAHALRMVGAAREAAYFATAPFVGALAATVIVGDALRPVDLVAMAMMAAGVVALLRERHAHEHAHEALDHDHVHVHDTHHQHAHGPDAPTGEPHAHPHHHAPLVHDHPHLPDLHHRHRH
jgi:drug/metabolite transporter (DMT)-like permease